jgi:ribosome-binding factor A
VSPASRGGRRAGWPDRSARVGTQRYPRSARVNNLLHEVLADTLERLSSADERLSFLTVTDVHCDPDLRAATVLFASLDDEQQAGLTDARVRLQAEVARQVRLKRTPLLSFTADPAVASGNRIEDILRGLTKPGEVKEGEVQPGEGGRGPKSSGPDSPG